MTRRSTAVLSAIPLILASLSAMLAPVGVRASAQSTPVASPVAVGSCTGPDGNGLIVHVELRSDAGASNSDDEDDEESDEGGSTALTAAVVVFASDGTEVSRTPLPDFATSYPLGVGCAVMLNSDADGAMLFNAATGVLTVLDVPDGYDDQLYPTYTWQRTGHEQRWAFLYDGRMEHTLLLDTQTGDLVDLSSTVQTLRDTSDGLYPISLTLTPDESALLLAADRDTWVMPTDDPSAGHLVEGVLPGRVSLSPDGTQILALASSDDDAFQVVTEKLDGSDRTVIGPGGRESMPFWVPNGDDLNVLVVNTLGGPGAATIYANGTPTTLDFDLPGTLSGRPYTSPSGRQLLFRVRTADDEIAWAWLNLDTGEGRRIPEVDGYPLPYASRLTGITWLTLFPSDRPSVDPGDSMRSINLETGEVTEPLTFDVAETYPGITSNAGVGVSADGRYAIVNDLGKNYPGFWLLDVANGTSRKFDGRTGYGFSPDGRSLLVGAPGTTGDNRVWQLIIMSLDGIDLQTLDQSFGRGGIWLPV